MPWDEERAGETLRMLMRDADLPPSGSDVERALRTGRRRGVRRRVLAAGAAAVAVAATASVAVVLTRDGTAELVADDRPVSCQLVGMLALPPGYTQGGLSAADRSGRNLLGVAQTSPDHPYDLVRWTDGVPTVVRVPAKSPRPVGINGRGDIIGNDSPSRAGEPDRPTAWLHRDGRFHGLVSPEGFRAPTVTAINDRGDIAGSALDGGGRYFAIVWPAGAPDQPRRLDAPGSAVAHAIGDDGTVAGSAGMTGGRKPLDGGQPYLWARDGRGRALDVPAGWEGGAAISVYDGWVLGNLYRRTTPGPEGREQVAARWRIRGGPAQILGEPGDSVTTALGPTGWLMTNTIPTAWSAPVLVDADGRIRRVPAPSTHPTRKGLGGEPIPVPVVGASAVWAREKGNELTVIANGSPEEEVRRPGTWRCQA